MLRDLGARIFGTARDADQGEPDHNAISVKYLPDDREVKMHPGETILEASLRSGIPHTHVCGGYARCSTCRVLVLEGVEHCSPRNDREQAIADRLQFGPRVRLACQATLSKSITLRRLVLDDEDIELTSQIKKGAVAGPVGDEKQVALLFADIRGFTPFAERLSPYDVIHALNRYFHQMDLVIRQHGGYINNYMGDGLMAIFESPNSVEAALRAVKAGLEMIEAAEKLKPYFEALYNKSFRIGVGVHFGEAVIGACGSAQDRRITAIGDTVNLASRIESANKEFGTSLLISEDAYAQVKEQVSVNRSVRVSLAGKSGEYNLYEVSGVSDTAA